MVVVNARQATLEGCADCFPILISVILNVIGISSAIEIDLTGQVYADSIGTKIYPDLGGEIDYTRGAFISERGKPVFTLSLRAQKGNPKIVPYLKRDLGVVLTRGNQYFGVTQ